jgi:hypothetical protein
MGRGARPVKAKVEARSTVTGKSRKIASATGLQLKQRLAEALEREAATSNILRVISQSPTDACQCLTRRGGGPETVRCQFSGRRARSMAS